MNKNECCPRFTPTQWDNKTHDWKNKLFVKDKVFTFFYIPINFGSIITKMIKKVEKSEAKNPDGLCLSDHTSKFNMNLYLAVDKKIPNAENIILNGKFLSKVYEGPFKNTGKWCEDFKNYAKSKNINIQKQYLWYTTCPKCAKKYGKNYVVVIAKVN